MDTINQKKINTDKNLKIFAIVVGIIILLGIIGIIVYFVSRKKSSTTTNPASKTSTGLLGSVCATSSDCDEKLTCSDGKCKKSCSLNSDCGTGSICSLGVCVSGTGSICTPPCSSGQTCSNGTCVNSVTCSSENDCKSNSVNKKCKLDTGTCVECNLTSDCQTGKQCSTENKCVFQASNPISTMFRLSTTHGFQTDAKDNISTENGTLEQCKSLCKGESSCKAFTRPAIIRDDENGTCILKKGPLDDNKQLYSNATASTDNTWIKIPEYKTFIPDTSSVSNNKNIYLKSTKQYIAPAIRERDEKAYDLSEITGTVSKCISECNKSKLCRGFNRSKSYSDNTDGTCYLKTTNVALRENDNNLDSRLQFNSWVNISVPEQVVSRGNFGCSGEKFCGQDWNNEFPYTWGGARCVGTISENGESSGENCTETVDTGRSVICQRDDFLGYFQRAGDNCNNAENRHSITGQSVNNPQTQQNYDYYKTAINIDDRILKLKTIEPRSGADKNIKCNDWCERDGYDYYATGQNQFWKDLRTNWKKRDNKCLSAQAIKNSGEKGIFTCDERLGDEYVKNCVCLKHL
jgi:hypothetical protein